MKKKDVNFVICMYDLFNDEVYCIEVLVPLDPIKNPKHLSKLNFFDSYFGFPHIELLQCHMLMCNLNDKIKVHFIALHFMCYLIITDD